MSQFRETVLKLKSLGPTQVTVNLSAGAKGVAWLVSIRWISLFGLQIYVYGWARTGGRNHKAKPSEVNYSTVLEHKTSHKDTARVAWRDAEGWTITKSGEDMWEDQIY